MTEIFGLTIAELTEVLQQAGFPGYRAKQIYSWLYQKSVTSFVEMRNISKADQEKLNGLFTILPAQLEIVKELHSEDGITTKFLLKLTDGATVETVLMHHDYGYSICVSSQVGCDMHCAFCASGLLGCQRSLTKAEILAQIYVCNNFLRDEGAKVSRVVVMGSGEPMLNFDNVFGALDFLHDANGANMSYRNMTVSTCGVVPGIQRMTELNHPINLAISLHAVKDELRTELMPINKAYPFVKVIAAAENYAGTTGREVTYEYILLKGKNDKVEDARLLVNFLKFKRASVNIIPANPVPEHGFERPTEVAINRFLKVLNDNHINATLRKEMGADINAACGQLRNTYLRKQ